MSAQVAFGRRAPPPQSASYRPADYPSAPARPAAQEPFDPAPFDTPDAEALKAELAAALKSPRRDDFDSFMARQRVAQVVVWVGSLALCAPGLICYLLHVPKLASAGVEVVGMIAAWLLRRHKRRQLKKIATWEG